MLQVSAWNAKHKLGTTREDPQLSAFAIIYLGFSLGVGRIIKLVLPPSTPVGGSYLLLLSVETALPGWPCLPLFEEGCSLSHGRR